MNITKIPVTSWGQRAEEEELDRIYYDQLDHKEKEEGLQSALEIVTKQNADLKRLLEDGRRVVGDYMGNEQNRTDQLNHLAAQVVRLQKEKEEWKSNHASLMELNKQCAQSNVDLHEQIEVLKYKADFDHKDMVKKLAAWIDVNTTLKKENEDLKKDRQIVEHLRARNVDLEKKVRDLNCIAIGGFACGHCVACRLASTEKVIDHLNWQLIKFQTSDTAHRKIIDFYKTACEILSKTLGILRDLSIFEWRRKRFLIKNSYNSVAAIQGNIDREFENLREEKTTTRVRINNPS